MRNRPERRVLVMSVDYRLVLRHKLQYCSSCKRFLRTYVHFVSNRRTCCACLLKARSRQHRARQRSGQLAQPVETKLERRCSSCKCMKKKLEFVRAGKTCAVCRNKRRKTASATSKSFRQFDPAVEFCSGVEERFRYEPILISRLILQFRCSHPS